MAEQYIDHGCYSNSGNIGSVPVWGLPQEGDGSSINPSAAASIASITLAANPAASNVISICGITFTAMASGAGNNQFNIGATIVDTANNIANAINGNGSTTTVSSNVAIGTPTLRNLVYARGPSLRGDSNPVVEIMMRVGSAALNYVNNSYVAITTSGWATVPTISQFGGGVGGCYGCLVNEVSYGSGVAFVAGDYGYSSRRAPFVMVHSDDPNVQRYTADHEYCWLRSKNGYTITLSSDFTMDHSFFPQNLVLDTNTKWPEDSGTGTFTVRFNTAGVVNRGIRIITTKVKNISCIAKYAFRFMIYSQTTASSPVSVYPGQGVNNGSFGRFTNILFGEEAIIPGNNMPYWQVAPGGQYSGCVFQNCKFSYPYPRSSFPNGSFVNSGPFSGMLSFEDCELEFNHTAVTDPGPISAVTFSGSRTSLLRFSNCSIRNISPSSWSSGKYQPQTARSALPLTEVVFDNCTGLRIDNYIGFSTSYSFQTPLIPSYYYKSADAGGAFRYETWQGVIEWNPDAIPSQPLLNSILPDGNTRYSLKVDWLNIPLIINESQSWKPTKMVQFTRGSASRKIVTLELFVKDGDSLNVANSSMRVQYTDTSGIARSEVLRYNSGGFIPSSAIWVNAENYPTYSAKKMMLETEYAVKPETEIAVYLELYTLPPSGQNDQFYIDPQFSLIDLS